MGAMNRKLIIGVIGAADASPDGLENAYEVGRLLATRGAALVCGGLGGIMAASAQGCFEAGGEVLGILPGGSSENANPYVTLPVVTAMGHARNIIIAHTAQALIAIEGGYGTLSEISIGLKLGKPVIQLNSWETVTASGRAETPRQAVDMVFAALKGGSV